MTTAIGIAVVEHENRYLVGIRSAGAPLAGYSEFPGGKCEPNEAPEACAVRECLEETHLTVAPVRLLEQVTWNYPHGRVELHFWLCRVTRSAEGSRSPFRWVSRTELGSLRFPEANARVIALLTSERRP